jgi:YfiH family protein
MTPEAWSIEEAGGLRFVRSSALAAIPEVAHAFATRVGPGGERFDPGRAAHVEAFVLAAGLGRAAPSILRQVHGRLVVDVSDAAGCVPEADGVLRRLSPGSTLPIAAVRTADCVPLLMADRQGRAVAAIHAGWRGTAAMIAVAAVDLFEAAGIPAGDLVVALGPSIRSCCYAVGDEVIAALGAATGPTVDLPAVNREQLVGAGIDRSAVHTAPWCTRCRPDLFFSARGEGVSTGRMMAAIGPAALP